MMTLAPERSSSYQGKRVCSVVKPAAAGYAYG